MAQKPDSKAARIAKLREDFKDPKVLRSYYKAWYPGGSGPIGAMYTITALIEEIAAERNVDLSVKDE